MSIPFIFPASRERYEVMQSIETIKAELERESEGFSMWRNSFKLERRNRGQYIYAKCKHCQASMRFKWIEEQSRYHLRTFHNQHIHLYETNINQELAKFIKELPLSIELATARKIATKKFEISPSKFYHTYSKLKKTNSTLPQLVRQLERRDYDISLDPFPLPEGTLPNIAVFISPEMKRMFKLYGQVVSYDLTYNIVQDISSQGRQYAVGVFTGVNCYNRIIPFAFTITCIETADAFTKIFETFIQINGSPRSFITDEQTSMGSAIKKLQDHNLFNGTHLIDSFHVLRNFSKMSERKDLQKEVSDIIREHCPVQFQQKMDSLKKKLTKQNELRAFQLFNNKRRQVCFSQLPRGSFVIFNASNSINEKMNDLIKSRIRSQKQYSQVLRSLVEFGEELIQSSQSTVDLYDFRIEEIFEDADLKLCRYLLAKRPMQELIKQYVQSLSLKDPEVHGNISAFHERYATYSVKHAGEEFDCSCGFTEKTGIGCKHMLALCRSHNINYMATVDARWKFEEKPVIKISKRMGRATRKRK